MKKTSKTLKNAGANSAAPIITALLAGVALGALTYAKKRELAAASTLVAKKIEPAIDGAKSKFGKAVEAVVTRGGDILINFGEAVDQARKTKVQRLRNPEMTHPQQDSQTRRAA